MSNIKPISINPDLFKVGGGSRKEKNLNNKTQKITTLKNNIQPNKLKRELLQKIKNYKQKENNEIRDNDKEERIESKKKISDNLEKKNLSNDSTFENEFMKSLNFLQQLSHKGRNKTMKANRPEINIEVPDNLKNINEDLDKNNLRISNVEKGEIPYGCLKNGNKPTFRQWKNHTVKNNSYSEPKLVSDNNFVKSINKDLSEENTLSKISINDFEYPKINDSLIKNEISNEINKNLISTKTKTIKYHLGKKNRKVSILIKNASTRKKINAEHNKIKRTTILEMKNYLRNHNLLKAGSEAPNDVIRKLYEQCLLSGNINNINKENLLHNFITEEK